MFKNLILLNTKISSETSPKLIPLGFRLCCCNKKTQGYTGLSQGLFVSLITVLRCSRVVGLLGHPCTELPTQSGGRRGRATEYMSVSLWVHIWEVHKSLPLTLHTLSTPLDRNDSHEPCLMTRSTGTCSHLLGGHVANLNSNTYY